MLTRRLSALLCVLLLVGAAWFSKAGPDARPAEAVWIEVAPGVLRTPGLPAGYALVDGDAAVFLDAPRAAEGLKKKGISKIDFVLLTHHHRDTCAAAAGFLAHRVPVRAPKASAPWLTPDGVRRHWHESIPLRGSRTAYLVVPAGLEGIDCSLADGQTIAWRGWTIQVVPTPGHSLDHVAFAARKGKDGPLLIFCGDALAAPGKLWTPFTTDWDHWTDAGLTPAGRSLRQLAEKKPAALFPAHGAPITASAADALARTASAVEEIAFLKSFERYTKQRLGNAPAYPFLAREQAESGGEKPWSRVSEHLFLTGNTYVLTSKDNAFLAVDPWGKLSADQLHKLANDRKLGPLEVVLVSHAHYDHYDGIYEALPDRDKLEVWTLDRVAAPIAEPYRWRAPFLDARPAKVHRRFRDGETVVWREYRFRFHHLPGQSEFTMGVEAVIDGKRCFFTADNFFHQDQYSGSGGWMGLNRSFPLPYAASAQKVLDAAPDWVLAEHGGPFAFSAEDFRRRVRWGQVSAAAADALCPTGNHRHDWDPNRVTVEPLLQKARPGETVRAAVVAANPTGTRQRLAVTVPGRGLIEDQALTLEVAPHGTARREFSCRLPPQLPAGRHVFPLAVTGADGPDGSDAFFVVEVGP